MDQFVLSAGNSGGCCVMGNSDRLAGLLCFPDGNIWTGMQCFAMIVTLDFGDNIYNRLIVNVS